MSDATLLLERAGQGDPNAASELLPLVYNQLRSLAAAKMAQERPGQTLQPTALVHEAWLKRLHRMRRQKQQRRNRRPKWLSDTRADPPFGYEQVTDAMNVPEQKAEFLSWKMAPARGAS